MSEYNSMAEATNGVSNAKETPNTVAPEYNPPKITFTHMKQTDSFGYNSPTLAADLTNGTPWDGKGYVVDGKPATQYEYFMDMKNKVYTQVPMSETTATLTSNGTGPWSSGMIASTSTWIGPNGQLFPDYNTLSNYYSALPAYTKYDMVFNQLESAMVEMQKTIQALMESNAGLVKTVSKLKQQMDLMTDIMINTSHSEEVDGIISLREW
jgi:uncharacterized coiled-coil protein SlyX